MTFAEPARLARRVTAFLLAFGVACAHAQQPAPAAPASLPAPLPALVAPVVAPAVPPAATPPAAAPAPWEAQTDGLVPVPALRARVTDLTNTLTPTDAQALDAKLATWEQQTGNQLVVLVVPTTKPEPIEAYSIRVAEAWKIGRKGQDNGALLVVAKDDKRLRI